MEIPVKSSLTKLYGEGRPGGMEPSPFPTPGTPEYRGLLRALKEISFTPVLEDHLASNWGLDELPKPVQKTSRFKKLFKK